MLRADGTSESRRPHPADRKFRSAAVEAFLASTSRRIRDPELAALFLNCFPNTLDTTVEPGAFAWANTLFGELIGKLAQKRTF